MKAERRSHGSEVGSRTPRVSFAVLGFLLAFSTARAQTDFTIDWYAVDGGGGSSSGGAYSVTGTIGQPDAGTTMQGGNYSLDGGFWSLLATAAVPGRPWLSIARSATNTVIISWASPSTGWTLQQNTNLSSVTWSDVSTSPTDDGTTKSVIITPLLGDHFYRLKR